MALPDLTGQNIQDTYQRLLQVSGTLQVTDGTGSLVPLLEVTASYAISASHEINIEISSSSNATVADPEITIPKCSTSQNLVPANGLASTDHFQPGS